MSEKITKTLYGGEVVIDFYPASHRYKLQGQKDYLISATACTGIIDKSRVLIGWATGLAGTYLRQYFEKSMVDHYTEAELLPVIEEALKQHQIKKDEAASIGSEVHAYAESFARAVLDKSELPDVPESLSVDDPAYENREKVRNGIEAFLRWFNENDVKFLESERMIYSRTHGYVGLTDVIAEVNGKKYVMDYKTAKGVYNEHFYQLSGYWLAYEEETGAVLDGGAILHFDKETGGFNFVELSRDEHERNYPVFLACLTIKQREKELSKY